MSAPQNVKFKFKSTSLFTWLGVSRRILFNFLAETEAAGAAFHLAGKFGKAARDARAMLIEASVFRPTARLTGGPRRTRISHLASLPYPSQQPSPSAPLRFEFELQLVRLRFFRLWLWLWFSKSSSPGLETWKVAQGMGGVRGSRLRCLSIGCTDLLPEYSPICIPNFISIAWLVQKLHIIV